MTGFILLIVFLLAKVHCCLGAVQHVTVKTKAKLNKQVNVHYRVPAGYQAKRKIKWWIL